MEWINQLKIAIVEENENRIEELLTDLPQFSSLKEMQSAAYLMQEAHNFLTRKKDEYASKLVKLKKQKEFLNSSINTPSSFDQSH